MEQENKDIDIYEEINILKGKIEALEKDNQFLMNEIKGKNNINQNNDIKNQENFEIEMKNNFENFKNEYAKLVKTEQNTKKWENKDIKTIEANIVAKENELNRINKKIFSGKPGLFEFKSDKGLKQLKQESVHIAKELFNTKYINNLLDNFLIFK